MESADNTKTIEIKEVSKEVEPAEEQKKSADNGEQEGIIEIANEVEKSRKEEPRVDQTTEPLIATIIVIDGATTSTDDTTQSTNVTSEIQTCDSNNENTPDRHRYTREQLLQLRDSILSNKQPNERDQLFLVLRGLWKFKIRNQISSKPLVSNSQDSRIKPPMKFRQNFNGNTRRQNKDDAIIMARKANIFTYNMNTGNAIYNSIMTNNAQSRYPSGEAHTNEIKYNGGARATEYDYGGGGSYDQYHWSKNRYQSFHQFQKSYQDRHPSHYRTEVNNSKPDQPEWYSDGPTSKYDVIDLHGFNEIEEQENKLQVDQQRQEMQINEKPKPKISSTPTKMVSDSNNNTEKNDMTMADDDENLCNQTISDSSDAKNSSSQYGDRPFNFDDFWSMDTHGYINGSGNESSWSKKNKSSRFSKWFKSGEHVYKRNDSLDSSLQNELNKLMNESGDLSNFDKSTESADISHQLLEIMHKFNKKQISTRRRSPKMKYIPSVTELEAIILNKSGKSTPNDEQQQFQNRQPQQNSQTSKTMLQNTAQPAGVTNTSAIDGVQFLQNFTRAQQHEYLKSLNIQMQQKLFQQMLGSASSAAANQQQRQSFFNFLNSMAQYKSREQRLPSNNYHQYQLQQQHHQSNNGSSLWMQLQHGRVAGGNVHNSGRPILKGNNFENSNLNGNSEQKNLHVHFQDHHGLPAFGEPSNYMSKENIFSSEESGNPIEKCNV